ncbi:MAG: adenylate/guanylate cyclase domain-containing protein [Alphaproteobacteria bacterium]|nr:adenylate/guanylate cyclase domain-containing protein [Alphaproteobacteria bacterium]
MERRLAAILAADIVGFSRLMERDEVGTLAALKAHRRELIDPATAEHHGRLVKVVGDGLLVEFASVVNAVECAMAIQQGLVRRNEGQDPDSRIEFRIGIHLGDVMVEEDDLYGDGVNVAARLEALAAPGGVCLSQQALDQVETKLDLQCEDLGHRQVKNIARPVHAWSWSPPGPRQQSRGQVATNPTPSNSPDRPSIAVLPFENMSLDPAQEYFSDGITEDIITMLARCRWLDVIARNSTFAYKGKSADVRRIAGELGAKYILEGSVRRSGDRVRISAQLVDGGSGTHLWNERYDRNLNDIFELQDEIAGVIAGTLEPELTLIENAALRGRSVNDLNAWDCYQRGLWHLYRFTADELGKAMEMFKRAIALDPDFAQAHARLAYAHIQQGWYGPWEDRSEHLQEAIACADQSVKLDDKEPATRLSLGRALVLAGSRDRGIAQLRVAVELDPSFAQAHFALGQALCFSERHEEALKEINEALRLSPRDPHLWTFLNARALSHYFAGDLERAEADERAALREPNVTHYPALILVALLGRQGRAAEAGEAITDLHSLRPGFTCADARREWFFGDRPYVREHLIERFLRDVRAAGLPE